MKFILLIFLLFSIPLFAQETNKEKVLTQKERTLKAINYLREGYIIVRLKTKKRQLDELTKTGQLKQANKVRTKLYKKHKLLINAFKTHFTVCPVYFVWSTQSDFIINKQVDSVSFLNNELKIDNTIKPKGNKFLTAEIGIIKEDTAQYYVGSSRDYHKDSTQSLYSNRQYSGGTNMSFEALIIKDHQFNQLYRPFPYYSRTFGSLFFLKKTYNDVVSLMNHKLKNCLK